MSEVREFAGWRTGLPLSLVILRGSLENMLGWVDDKSAVNVETGVVRLAELRGGRVREIAAQSSDDWAGHSLTLQVGFARLADEWAIASPVQRKAQLFTLVEFLNAWDAELRR